MIRLITGSPVGLDGGIELSRSTVEGNDTGFIHNGVNSQAIHGNRFDNTLMNLVYRGSRALDMSGNWWGSREPAAILSKIRDARTDGNLGLVTFSPYWADTNGTSTLTYSDTIEADSGTALKRSCSMTGC